jgi:hypothetical protein
MIEMTRDEELAWLMQKVIVDTTGALYSAGQLSAGLRPGFNGALLLRKPAAIHRGVCPVLVWLGRGGFRAALLLRVWAAPLNGAFPDGARLASGRLFGRHFRRSEHDRIVGNVIIRALSDPVVVGCDPKHHRPNCWIVSLFRQRPHFLGSHAPVRRGPEKIVRVGDALASQMGVLHFPPGNVRSVAGS